ncbi:GerAB/ArcD/ProY family transporter [Tumebacillus permanentifrigoris]|uniref:Spore germination protein KB n=1 Tax=Tumebacillus permanentifrigoris TaxID=378543 RepID=A0A316D6E4_9BACL|nr:GerAB/ArcD/ProY family transporter [Tumebacillus permanentifrigoris]PWK10243.1 spore germination protein KB [Tumebacillus permanentifrigoris]
MEKLGSIQFVALLILFQVGSYVIFGFASSAKQDAWLVALLSMVSGLFLTLIYYAIYALYPGLNYVEILRRTFGSGLGGLLGACYLIAFTYVAGRVLRDFGELVTTFILPRTPILVVLFCLVFVCYYGLNAGIEVVGRVAEFMLFLFLFFLLTQTIFLTGSGLANFEFLLPIAHDKKAIVQSLIPLGITVPFGETIAFLMFYNQVRRQDMVKFLLMFSVVGAGLVLMSLNLLAVAILGPELYARNIYPMITAVQQVSVADFVESLDALIVIYIGIAAFFKITVFMYSAAVGASSLFRLQEYRTVLIPLSVAVLLLSTFMSKSLPEHVFIGLNWVPWVLWVPLFIILPILVLGIGMFRTRGERGHVEAKNR